MLVAASCLTAALVAPPSTTIVGGGALVAPPSTTIVGGGPAGLATAIMLARKGYKNIKVLDRLPPPAAAGDASVWSDTAKHYLVGLGGRGQVALKEIGAWEGVVEPFCSTVVGRKDWNPGASVDEGVERIFTDRPYKTRVIPRDRMVSCMYEHVKATYPEVEFQHGVEVSSIKWVEESEQELAVLNCEPCVTSDSSPVGEAEACAALEDGPGAFELRTSLLIGADGTRRTIANAMEADDAGRLNPFRRFRVTRYADTSVRVYKTVALSFPPDWRRDINYSCRTPTINFDALPTLDGEYCGVLLIKPDDAAAQSLPDVAKAREYFDELLPQFSPAISDATLSQVIAKPPSRLPVFRFVGPRLHRGASTVLLGDAIHTVKPYFGLGVNSAFEDVTALSRALDEARTPARALEAYSRKRAPEAKALVQLSRSFDRSGFAAFLTFVLPLILDGIFHGAMPKLFAPNTLQMLQRVDVSFEQIRWRKRLDRAVQVALLGAAGAAIAKAVISGARLIARQLLSQIGGPTGGTPVRLLLSAVPLAATLGFALRKWMTVGGDVADVLAAQKEGLGKAEEPEPLPASASA